MSDPPDDGALWDIARGDQPILATAIHDGHDLRAEVADLMVLPEPDRLREEDPNTSTWTEVVQNRLVVRRSRFEVDLNRPADRAVYREPDDAWGLDLWRRPLADDIVARSLAEYHAFYEVVRGILNDIEQQFGSFVVLDLHSYNHRRSGPGPSPADEADNPVVNVGTGSMDRGRWGPLVDRFMADLGECEVAGRPLDVRENVRFHGGHFSGWVHETYPSSGCALAIEFKKVFMDEWTGEIDPDVVGELSDAVRSTVPGLLESLAGR